MKLGKLMQEFLDCQIGRVSENKQDDFQDCFVYFMSIHGSSMNRLTYKFILNHFKKMILYDVKMFRVYYPYRANIDFLFDCLRFYRRNYDSEFEIPDILCITNDLPSFCKDHKLLGHRYRYLLKDREEEEKKSKQRIEENRRRKRSKQIAKANDKRKRARIKDQRIKRCLSIMAYLGKTPIIDEAKENK